MYDLGVRHKDLYGAPEPVSSKDYDNEKVYPSLDVSGKQAELMGAEDLQEGECVIVPVKLRVKRHSKTVENGKTRYSMCLCVEAMGDMEECEDESDSDGAEYGEDMANLRTTLSLDE
jgi:hypothetical protein